MVTIDPVVDSDDEDAFETAQSERTEDAVIKYKPKSSVSAATTQSVVKKNRSRASAVSVRTNNNIVLIQRIVIDLMLLVVSIVSLVTIARARKSSTSVASSATALNVIAASGLGISVIMAGINAWRLAQNNSRLGSVA